ncbi:hypothetical protein GCM10015535_43840 [Streptomyces gelaticus]|uniref:Molybdopterin oxidoreductase domain-containing protein n=1 Tax=Streptomyces gelaticus TaxID=285446 RepID=A0ABQ2W5S1_9ACTN|nr:hypothetical protein GCM10015535_43840 [Streptomyces gelaticus]
MRLCPKGINAYQQVNHPERLTAPLMRRSRDEDFREVSWDEALDFTVAEIERIQQSYGGVVQQADTTRCSGWCPPAASGAPTASTPAPSASRRSTSGRSCR